MAKDLKRPFEVEVDKLKVRALGTVFQVYRSANHHIKVSVQEHSVAVSRLWSNKDDQTRKDSVVVETGQQLQIISQEILPKPEKIRLNQVTAWQQKRLIINDQPLGELINELERYRNGRIFLADEELKSLRITGVFSLEDPESVLQSVIKVLKLKEIRIGAWWVILQNG